MKNIIGFYKNYMLVEEDGSYYVVNRQERKVLFKGNEEMASKTFIMIVANFIDDNLEKVEA